MTIQALQRHIRPVATPERGARRVLLKRPDDTAKVVSDAPPQLLARTAVTAMHDAKRSFARRRHCVSVLK